MSSRSSGAARVTKGVVAGALLAGAVGAGVRFGEPIKHLFSHSSSTQPSQTQVTPRSADSAQPPATKPLWTCSMHPQVIMDSPGLCPICHMQLVPLAAAAHVAAHDDEVRINPAIVQNMGIRTTNVVSQPLVRTIRAVGTLEEPEPMHRDINLRVNGWIEKLHADTDGMDITKGQSLFDLYSPESLVAVEEMINARKSAGTEIVAPDNSSRQKLINFGFQPDQVDALSKLDKAPRTIPVLAPIDGHLTSKMVNEGAAVKSGDLVMRLANRNSMWLDLQIYEQDLPVIKIGQSASISTASQPGREYVGTVSFIHPHLDMATRSAKVRITIDNADHALHEGMYASASLTATVVANAVVVPREAIIDTGSRQIVFLKTPDGFAPRDVHLGSADGSGMVQIVDGLTCGEVVVTSGQFLLDSESRTQEAVQKYLKAGNTDNTSMNMKGPK